MPIWLPLVFLASAVLFNYLQIKSWKPVYNNPVVFHDSGNPWLFLMTILSVIGFALSVVWLGITG